jgi:hypothetical protein
MHIFNNRYDVVLYVEDLLGPFGSEDVALAIIKTNKWNHQTKSTDIDNTDLVLAAIKEQGKRQPSR